MENIVSNGPWKDHSDEFIKVPPLVVPVKGSPPTLVGFKRSILTTGFSSILHYLLSFHFTSGDRQKLAGAVGTIGDLRGLLGVSSLILICKFLSGLTRRCQMRFRY